MIWLLRRLLFALAGVFGLTVAVALVFKFTPIPITPLMVSRAWENYEAGRAMSGSQEWKGLDEISPHLPICVMLSEDQRFLEHFGLQHDYLTEFMQQNPSSRKVEDRPTLTQQVAADVFSTPSQAFFPHLVTTYYTLLIELLWSKRRTMEVYLNVVEWGDGLYGAEAAARYYYNKPAKELTKTECALLAAILPSPRKLSPVEPDGYVRRRKSWILRTYRKMPPLTKESI
jgi:monofunctional glycosyltransferase